MMIDFISATKHLQGEDSIFLGHLQPEASYSTGWKKYLMQGCKNLAIWHNEANSVMRIEGSFAYFVQGHNFNFDNSQFVEAGQYIGGLLETNIFDFEIDIFEFGKMIQVEDKPKNYILNHRENPKQGLIQYDNPKDKGNFRRWESPEIRLKMYDASRNILHKQGMKMKDIIQESGWNPEGNTLKIEAYYKKPHLILNGGRRIKLGDLVHPNWQKRISEDLYYQYKKLIPLGMIEQPNNKKDLSTQDLLMIALAEGATQGGKTLIEVKKMLYDRINAIPDEILSPTDKKARKRQILSLIGKIHTSPQSKWDLSDKLKEALSLKEQENT
jgi:hypothetical protein